MSELALKSTTGATFIGVGPGQQIAAVRADGGAVEILGREQASGAICRLRIQPTNCDLGWVTPPKDVTWIEFRATDPAAECIVHMAPLVLGFTRQDGGLAEGDLFGPEESDAQHTTLVHVGVKGRGHEAA